MYWIALLFWINIAFSQTSKDVPVEISEDEDMLNSIEELMKQPQNDIPVAEPRILPTHNIRELSESFAMEFLNYAAASYCNKDEIERWDCYNCQGHANETEEVVYVSNDDHKSAAFLGVNHNRSAIVVSYRGTSNFKNWLINLNINLTNLGINHTSPIRVHSGFNKAANALVPKIYNLLDKAKKQNPEYKVVFTGHSLGGALATLSAVKFAERGVIKWSDIQIITFGQPRVGDASFANYLNSKPIESARVTTRGDIVAISPAKKINYYHSQHIVHMDLNGTSIGCSNTKEDDNCTKYFKHLKLSAHFTFQNQRINSNCVDPETADRRNWFQKARDNTAEWFRNAKNRISEWFKKTPSK
jgi:hypothetical protein